MSIDIPESAKEVENRTKTDVQIAAPTSNPFLKNSWIAAIIIGYSNRIYDFYLQLQEAIKQSFVFSATGEQLERLCAIWGKQKLAATQSSGNAVATGVAGGFIPLGTSLVSGGINYITTTAATVSDNVILVSGITRSGQTATVTTVSDHGMASLISVTVSLAASPEYNITATITVIALDQFQYQVAGSPANEGAGASVAYTTATFPIQSVDFGVDTDLDAGDSLQLQSPIVNVDENLIVDFGAIGGGADQEGDESLRDRTQDRIQNPVALFNVAAITDKAREVAGVTRVFVQEITPALGQVTVYFMRDNDDDPIPTGSEVFTVKERILTIKPATTGDADVIVMAPVPVSSDYTFTALSPNTPTMQTAIIENLDQFYAERTDVEVNVDEDAYRSAIFNTVDTVTGDIVQTFTLSSPTGDIVVSTGEIGVRGNVNF